MKYSLYPLCLLLLISACVEKKVNSKTSTTEPVLSGANGCLGTISGCGGNTSTPTPTTPTTPLLVPPDLPTIIGHGNEAALNNVPGVLWSSSTVSSLNNSYDQSLFATDTSFQIRIMAKASPGQNTRDSYGKLCEYYQIPYGKLKVDVRLRTKASVSWSRNHTFSDIIIGQKSEIKTFNYIPPTEDPMVVEITRVQWDFECNVQGRLHLCPYAPATANHCWELGLEISTDSMKNLDSL